MEHFHYHSVAGHSQWGNLFGYFSLKVKNKNNEKNTIKIKYLLITLVSYQININNRIFREKNQDFKR